MLCSNCDEILPDDAQFCLKCGKALDRTVAVNVGATRLPPVTGKSTRAKRKSRVAVWILPVLLGLLVIGWASTSDNNVARQLQELVTGARTETITEKTFSVNAHSFTPYKFTVPPGAVNVIVSGQFSAGAGTGNEVEVYVLGEDAFITWRNGFSTNSYYDSGKEIQGSFASRLPLGEGAYYLVFSNTFSSSRAPKAIRADVTLHYNRWWPDWLFQLKDKLFDVL